MGIYGGNYCSDEKWYLKRQLITNVNKYKYLGVWITSNLNWSTHLISKELESRSSIGATWSSVYNNENIDLRVKIQIFETVTLAILLYAAQVWGFMFFDKVEQVIRYFYKRIFNLPLTTPSHILKTEFGIADIYLTSFKLHVDYIVKTLKMPDNRIPKKLTLHAFQNKTLWFQEWFNLGERLGVDLNLNLDNLNTWKSQMINIFNLLHQENILESTSLAVNSQHRLIYKQLTHNIYLTDSTYSKLTIKQQSIIFKARSELLSLNYQPHRTDLPQICSLCGTNEREDIFHFIGYCNFLSYIRKIHFGKTRLDQNEIVNILDGSNWLKLVKYITEASLHRKRMIEEIY